jgi:hypothetical protein
MSGGVRNASRSVSSRLPLWRWSRCRNTTA